MIGFNTHKTRILQRRIVHLRAFNCLPASSWIQYFHQSCPTRHRVSLELIIVIHYTWQCCMSFLPFTPPLPAHCPLPTHYLYFVHPHQSFIHRPRLYMHWADRQTDTLTDHHQNPPPLRTTATYMYPPPPSTRTCFNSSSNFRPTLVPVLHPLLRQHNPGTSTCSCGSPTRVCIAVSTGH